MNKRFVTAFMAAVMVLSSAMTVTAAPLDQLKDFSGVLTGAVEAPANAGSTMETAQNVKFGETVTHTRQDSDVDWYTFELPSSGLMNLKGTGNISMIRISILNENGETLGLDNSLSYRDISWNSTTQMAAYDLNARLTKGKYHIKLEKSKSYSSQGSYNFKLSFTNANESFEETGWGSNNSMFTANDIKVNTGYKGQTANNDYQDFFKFKLEEEDEIRLTLTRTSYSLDWRIYNDSGQMLQGNKHGHTSSQSLNTTFKLNAGTYYFYVGNTDNRYSSNYVGTYSFTLTSQNPANWGSIALSKATAANLTATGKTLTPKITVTDKNGRTVDSSKYSVKTSPSPVKKVGTYTATITGLSNYTGKVSAKFKVLPKGTSIASVSAIKNGFTVKYKKQAVDTKGYEIQYATNKSFSGAKTQVISKNTTLTSTISKLTAGKTYYVRVRTYQVVKGVKYYSTWSSAKTVKTKK